MKSRDTRSAEQIGALKELIDSIQENGPLDALVIRGVANVVSDDPVSTVRINHIHSHFASTLAMAHMLRQAADEILDGMDAYLGADSPSDEHEAADWLRELLDKEHGYDH